MKILAIDRFLPGTTMETVQPYLQEEMKISWKHYKQGTVREWYFRQDQPGVVLILECDSIQEAENLINEYPLVKEELITFDLIPLGPFEPLESLLNL